MKEKLWDMNERDAITQFTGKHYFLSNFYASPILHDDILYPTNEHFFQAMKSTSRSARIAVALLTTPNAAKQMGRTLKLRDGWDDKLKFSVMTYGVKQKFKIRALRKALLLTGDSILIEGNTWGDRLWGTDLKGRGRNELGKTLMAYRYELQQSMK